METKQVLDNPEKNQKINDDNYLLIISCLLVTCYLTANIMAVKLVNFAGITMFDAGTITFPIAYMLGDVLTEVWGFKTAKKVIFITFFCNVLLIISTTIGVWLPYPPETETTAQAYGIVFSYVPRIVLASLVGFLGGELSNAWIMVQIRQLTKGKFLWIRTIVSSMVGYVFDTVVFVIIAFAGIVPTKDLLSMIAIQYIIKVVIEAIAGTPLAYGLIAFLKKKRGEA